MEEFLKIDKYAIGSAFSVLEALTVSIRMFVS